MNQQEILNKLNDFKSNLQNIWEKFSEHAHRSSKDAEEDFADYPAEVDDLPLTLNRESRPGIKFYSTENSSIAVGATKGDAEGIDSFGEDAEDDEVVKRAQNSDLSKRFYTGGLDLDDLNRN